MLLTLALLGISLGTYLRSRPNTGGAASADPFDGDRGFADLRQIVAFGPRPSSSPALERCTAFIIGEQRSADVTVSEDRFTATTPSGGIPMTDILATIPGVGPSIVVIGGHHDTKRIATPLAGANDGGSSAAFLLEMARVLTQRHNKATYWLVLFDGEEALGRWSVSDGLYGSRHFTRRLADGGAEHQINDVIVIDMIGDNHFDIQREKVLHALADRARFRPGAASRLRPLLSQEQQENWDDQLAFLQLGIPAVEVIDLDYGPLNLYWQTRFDTVDKCSPASLAIVGDTVLSTLDALENAD